MSYPLIAALNAQLGANTALTAVLSTIPGTNNTPAIYPYHHRDIENPTYPLITIATFGQGMGSSRFDDSQATMGRFERPRLAICVWSTKDIDEAYAIYQQINPLRGTSVQSIYVSSWRMDRTLFRDDLFDQDASAYHLHSEWLSWVETPFGVTMPIFS
jgi:hypothetical protein